jgi:pyridoxine 4-dehydrogenase
MRPTDTCVLQTSDEQAFAAIKASVDGGCTMLNSGEFYGYPEPTLNLQLLNRFYTKYPEYISKTYLSVKGGLVNMQPVATEENLRKSVTNINTILGVKKMDLFEMARVDKSVSIEDTMQILLKLRDEGHFKDIGLSEVSAETINRAVKVAPIAAVEVE